MPKKMTNEEFLEKVYNKVKDEYTFLEPYIKSNIKIKVKHNICGNIYPVAPVYFLQGTRCPYCYSTPKKDTETFKKEMYEKYGNRYTILGEYIDNKTKIKVRCNVCGYEYLVKPYHILCNGKECAKCKGVKKKTTIEFSEEVNNLTNGEYELLSEYTNNKAYVILLHHICNETYQVKPNVFLNGRRCPICDESKGETVVRLWLEDNNIKFTKQYPFEDCKDIRVLPFDFYLNDMNICIEYDGIQHYDKDTFYGDYETIKLHDNIKTKYCEDNNIKLIRIPYWEFNNIDEILEEELLCQENILMKK